MLNYPAIRYRATKTSDGEGGFTETFGSPVTIYISLQTQDNQMSALVDMYEDILVDDVVDITMEESLTAARYRVIDLNRQLGTRWKKITLNRVARPL
jgi:hypothetical protein